ncbi:MAG: CRISPR-associated protein Cas4 [Anaerolineae bacterium]|nr:CRISPR-associated protein Cas4 [Anaerolineae bacterium]
MIAPESSDAYLRVNEIKNYLYCPRVSYYGLCLDMDRETDLSHAGVCAEQEAKRLMKRRKRALHAVHEGTRRYDVTLVSHRYRIVGRIDEIVDSAEGVYLVDYKDTSHDYGYWRMQMTAYRLAAIESGLNVLNCFVYTIPDQQYVPVVITAADERKLHGLIDSLLQMATSERCPPAVDKPGKCRSCQYANFCGDVF